MSCYFPSRMALLDCCPMTTASDKIYEQISADIVSGALEPGQKLDEQAIASRFGVSRTPIRETFKRLASAGLVESKPRRGVTVVNFDLQELTDMYEALEEFESLAARLSAERMTAVERKQLQRLHQDSQACLEQQDVAGFARINDQFHQAIHRGARNKTLSDTIAALRLRLNPFRQPWLFRERNRLEVSFGEHQLLTEAIVAGDPAAAFEAMHHHTSNTSLITLDYLAGKLAG